jgi:hypothetical protein
MLLLVSCSRAPESKAPAIEPPPAAEPGLLPFSPPEALAAVLLPGEHPLWFEAAPEEGARPIESPAESALVPFTPWPLAPHVAAALPWGEGLYLALNRSGLLALIPLEGGGLGLYRINDGPYWESYTLGNLFLYEDRPALFFYRDDSFAEPSAPPPVPPVLGLLPGGAFTGLGPLEIPALGDIPFAEGWEADILRAGADGLWYYRGLRRKNGGRELRYFRSADLSRRGEEIDAGTYRNSQREAAGVFDPDAALPELPENFVYTHAAPLGDFMIAAWEEQEDYNIGAAGFMVIRAGTPKL